MKTRLLSFLDMLRSSYWFLPTLMTLAAMGMASGIIALDEAVKYKRIAGLGWIFTGGSDGARGLLSTVASSVITVAGVVFSITIAALSLASSQFGPRLLRNFLRDRGNQAVLGTFLGTFTFSLMTLRTVRSVDEVSFVPHIGVTVSVGLAMASLAAFIFFIHHVSTSIQASQIIAVVAEELDEAIERLFPANSGQGPADADAPADAPKPAGFVGKFRAVPAETSGYIQRLDTDALLKLATENDLVIEVLQGPGEFTASGETVAKAWPQGRVPDDIGKNLAAAWGMGRDRTMVQDARFGIDQLAEVAARALSPGINDPFTAMMCLDRLGAALGKLAGREAPSARRHDDQGKLRLHVKPVTFADMADAAFDPIRLYGKNSFSVLMRLLEAIAAIAPHAARECDRETLRAHVTRLIQNSRDSFAAEDDKTRLAERADETLRVLRMPEDSVPSIPA